MKTISTDLYDELVENSVYMRAIMTELGVTTPKEALEIIRAGQMEKAA